MRHKAKTCILSFLLLLPLTGQAEGYLCTIRDVLQLTGNGSMASHGWATNYQNRRFTLDAESGKVTGTTALKVRLSNYNADYQPVVLRDQSFQSVTLYMDSGRYSVIQIETGIDNPDKPFFYRTAVGMFLTGTCIKTENY